ncbi:integrase/recombinase XerC [bacterium A37T11]|nr:integrase/recombinase XerC [bacterium A37T11]
MFIDRFRSYLQFEKRYSAHTVSAYVTDLQRYHTYLANHGLTDADADHRDVRSYFADLIEAGQSPSSVNRHISALRTYYKFLNREELIHNNPMPKVRVLKTPKKLPVVINEEKLISLLDSRELFPEGFEGLRDLLVLEFLFGTGARRAELVSIEEKDVDLYNKTVRVLGKRNKERLIPLNRSLLLLLKEYLEEKKAQPFENKTSFLIVTNSGKQAYPDLVYLIVKKYLSLITSQQKKSPHVLRHTFATSMLNHGAELNDIKELLGHAGLAATQIYTHNTVERLKLIYKQAHPKA